MSEVPETKVAMGSLNDTPGSETGISDGGTFEIDRAKEAKVVKKLDLFITPILFIVYLSCFIDRANIGQSSCCDPITTPTLHRLQMSLTCYSPNQVMSRWLACPRK